MVVDADAVVATASEATVELRLRVVLRAEGRRGMRTIEVRRDGKADVDADMNASACSSPLASYPYSSSSPPDDSGVDAGEGVSSSSFSSSVHVCLPATRESGLGFAVVFLWRKAALALGARDDDDADVADVGVAISTS